MALLYTPTRARTLLEPGATGNSSAILENAARATDGQNFDQPEPWKLSVWSRCAIETIGRRDRNGPGAITLNLDRR